MVDVLGRNDTVYVWCVLQLTVLFMFAVDMLTQFNGHVFNLLLLVWQFNTTLNTLVKGSDHKVKMVEYRQVTLAVVGLYLVNIK